MCGRHPWAGSKMAAAATHASHHLGRFFPAASGRGQLGHIQWNCPSGLDLSGAPLDLGSPALHCMIGRCYPKQNQGFLRKGNGRVMDAEKLPPLSLCLMLLVYYTSCPLPGHPQVKARVWGVFKSSSLPSSSIAILGVR